MLIQYGFFQAPYGLCCLAFVDTTLVSLCFIKSKEEGVKVLKTRFPNEELTVDMSGATTLGTRIFDRKEAVDFTLYGTDFQMSVWKALCNIPVGSTTTYGAIAEAIGRPKAVRAVGSAVGANPVAWLVPCHRVVRSDGKLGGYRWGLDLKKALLQAEGITW